VEYFEHLRPDKYLVHLDTAPEYSKATTTEHLVVPGNIFIERDYQKASSRHRHGESYAVRANPILGGLHHEYFLTPSCA